MLILNYHRVGLPPKDARYRGMYVSRQMLAWHVRLLKRRGLRFTTVSAGVALGCPKDACALTFDDGYLDNFTDGLPILSELQVPATVYVVTGDVGKSNVLWQEAGDRRASDLMSWEQLKALTGFGWEIGSHASDHIHLARKSLEEQRRCIDQSWQDIRLNLGTEPTSFAYPYGSFNADTISVLGELGCKAAVTTDASGANTASTPPLMLYRKPARGHQVHHALKSISLLWRT